ncbi:DUF6975 family protein, partial [Escherichia coli]|uniref:DUF6975 family protein n=2 Tax=Pseudomonadota TaxID=1224 RepID=UPI00235E8923
PAIRAVLDTAAERFGVPVTQSALPSPDHATGQIAGASPSPSVERAVAFAVQQVLAQHRALWGLIESRASARGDL